ncbi:VOC family protein [Nonomuraea sp. NPDC050790]|uniref:VOC family protein n=1 Tax=Nonomuraea sp. NPDC050790 TaxID=3364371 RepID=UPI003789671C
MKLIFLYQPVSDLQESVAFYRDELGLDESWRMGDTTVAFRLPGTEVELMLDITPADGPEWGKGGGFLVDSVEGYIAAHPNLKWVGEVKELPDGKSATFVDPSGNPIHLFDQSTAGPQ